VRSRCQDELTILRPANDPHGLIGNLTSADLCGELTHAITIRRSPQEVWPWLVQMGGGAPGRTATIASTTGGSPASATRSRAAGHPRRFPQPAVPGMTEGCTVLRVAPERVLVIGWLPPSGGPPMTMWSFVIDEPEPGCTRLLVRVRASADYHPPFGLPDWAVSSLVPWGHSVMQRRQLLGIRERAEGAGREEPPGLGDGANGAGVGGCRRPPEQITEAPMDVPFTVEQFLGVFGAYNRAVWPMQVVFYAVAAGMVLAVRPVRVRAGGSAVCSRSSGAGWESSTTGASSARSTRRQFRCSVRPSGQPVPRRGALRPRLGFRARRGTFGTVGWILIGYALVIYPVVSALAGHAYREGQRPACRAPRRSSPSACSSGPTGRCLRGWWGSRRSGLWSAFPPR
jgi:hypothetical protein